MKKLAYYKNLDALRAFAALAVVVAHYFSQERMPAFSAIHKIAELGNSGVSLFFVLSGFVITRILMNTYQSPAYFKSFYIRRSLRIFPLYYAALLLYFIYPYFTGAVDAVWQHAREKSYFLFYFQNVARTFDWISTDPKSLYGPMHYWSLAVEEHFYLFWPAIVYFTMKKGLPYLIRASVLMYVFTHVLRGYMSHRGYEINVFTFTRLDQLILGAGIAILEIKGLLSTQKNKYFIGCMLLGGMGLAGLEIIKVPLIKETFKHSFFGFMYAGLIMWVIANQSHFVSKKILEHSALQYLGKISYGIYVWHLLLLYLLDRYLPIKPPYGFFSILLATLLLASMSYYWLERPFLRWKEKFHS